MDRTTKPIDDHTLASFIAGTLPAHRRREVASFLAKNANARELLHMAYEAMDATKPVLDPAKLLTLEPQADQPMPSAQTDRPPHHLTPRLQRLSRYIAGAVVLFAVGLSLRLAFGPPTVLLRGDAEVTLNLTLPTTLDAVQFGWTAIPEAYQYRLVIYDPEEARVVARHTTDQTQITLTTLLTAQHPYMARVDAIDAENRIIQSSEMTTFTLRE